MFWKSVDLIILNVLNRLSDKPTVVFRLIWALMRLIRQTATGISDLFWQNNFREKLENISSLMGNFYFYLTSRSWFPSQFNTKGPFLFNPQNPSVQHKKKLQFNTPLNLTPKNRQFNNENPSVEIVCWTESYVELKGFLLNFG